MAVRSPPVVCVGLNQVKPWFASESPANRKSSALHPRSTRGDARSEVSPVPTAEKKRWGRRLRSHRSYFSMTPQIAVLFGCFGEAGAQTEIGFSAINVISRKRGSFNGFEKLNLKNYESIVPERGLESGKVVFPH